MKVKKISDTDNIQAYQIINPSKKFKKMFPKKYILSLDIMGRHSVMNVNTLPNKMILFAPIGYIFTYGNKLPNLSSDKVKYEDIGSTFARCLDSYFIGKDAGDSKDIDLILACGSKNKIVPPTLTEEIIIRCNSNDLIKNVKNVKLNKNENENGDESEGRSVNVKNNIMTIINSYISEVKYNVEDWIKDVVFSIPLNNNGLPVRYPNEINNKNINKFKLNADDVFIEYDFRAKTYEHENEFISNLENAFESPDLEIQITNTYNNILNVIKDKLKEKGYKWKDVGEDTIKTKLKYLRGIDVEYQLTDFI